ncbi:MAG: NEW3 domain-containing protein [Candidatus Nanohaloarchaea archaeon]
MEPEKLLAVALTVIVIASFVAASSDDNSTFSVSVDKSCQVTLWKFQPPGNGTIAQNATGTFFTELENTGSTKANITIPYLNVTKEDDRWQPGEEKGEVVKHYNGTKFTGVNISENVYYAEEFYANYTVGWYTGREKYVVDCYTSEGSVYSYNFTAYANFEIVAGGGEVGANATGNETTNATVPEDFNSTGNESVNKTTPEDANQTGEESNETIKGNNDAPGQTPVPEPEPEPEPEPVPLLTVDIEPDRRRYYGIRGQYVPVNLTISNEGDQEVTDVSLQPQLGQRQGWSARNAQISALAPGENVSRQVFVQVAGDEDPGLYVVPVKAIGPQNELDLDYFYLQVNKTPVAETPSSRLDIVESPSSLNVLQNTTQPVPILIENTGETNLTNISTRVQNVEGCGTVNSSPVRRMDAGETASLNLTFESGLETETCNTTLILSSDQGAYAFSNIEFTVVPSKGLIPREQRAPFIAVAWAAVLVAYAFLRRRFELDSIVVNAPFVLLVVGESLILLYLLVEQYGIVQLAVLPF